MTIKLSNFLQYVFQLGATHSFPLCVALWVTASFDRTLKHQTDLACVLSGLNTLNMDLGQCFHFEYKDFLLESVAPSMKNERIALPSVSHMSASPGDRFCPLTVHGNKPPADTPSKEKEQRMCKGCRCSVWHQQGQQAEKSVMLTGVSLHHLTMNCRQTSFFFPSTTTWGDNRRSIRRWGSNSSISSQCYILDVAKKEQTAGEQSFTPPCIPWSWGERNGLMLNYLPFNQWHRMGKTISRRMAGWVSIHHTGLQWC